MNNSRFKKIIVFLTVMCLTCLSFDVPLFVKDSYVYAADDKFEEQMNKEGFPESYKPYLREMHEQHPSWVFKAKKTGLSWNDVMEGEKNIPGRVNNLIYGSYYYPHYNWRSTSVGYNWSLDSYSPYDGSVWYAASDDILAYYLDPRTYLDEEFVFAFETLDYQKGYQNINGIEAILEDSFMYNTTPAELFKRMLGSDVASSRPAMQGDDKKFSQIILEAAEAYGVSAYHLASRIRLEMGSSAGVASLGNSTSYNGIYNYFNIGAFDSSVGEAVLNGLRFAAGSGSYGRPWDSVYKAIMGGAAYLAEDFISEGQNTIYTQKFNVTNNYCLFYNQYMSNIQAPATEASLEYDAYVSKRLIDSSFVFEIPVYTDMPESAVVKPADSGSPNNWLDSLSVSGYNLSPGFSGDNTDYTVAVPDSVTSINVSADTVNSSASFTGTGSIDIGSGEKTITIEVTAENGNVRKYNLTIKRDNNVTANQGGSNNGGDGTPLDTTHRGDLNGDGKINALDIIFVQRLIVGMDPLTDEKKALADINGDGKVNALDIIFIQRHIVGLEKIVWN
ncbi:MAG: cadherin-like beta sandwich domain-containing protein [Eubacterium sp.]|nr:cadherin-like beta sandwich domain-containing protein [Eubacterium sp.]